MATEAIVGNPVDASAPSDAKLILNPAELDPRHVASERANLNGSPALDEIENKRITNVEDQLNSADVSVSGGSDTEASKGDASSRGKDGEKGHLRSASTVKKPATFKAVSVNKTFLASKSGGQSPSLKPVDKVTVATATVPSGSAMLSASRPRLVAKTGSGSGTQTKFSAVVNGAKGSAGPDPNIVWNKNRPVPAPEPKRFTDEELKKYGIHMASRLGPESTQGHNNWADEDDDDEDWAPDTITWTDGTKVTLPQPDENTAPLPEPAPPVIKDIPAQVAEKPKSPVPTEGPAPPSIKSSVFASGKGLVLKAASAEKPALVAKPPSATSNAAAKSPWAKLPPVDRTSPVAMTDPSHSQAQGGPARYPGRESQAANIPSQAAHYKEIAADDFSRSTWREGPTAGNRELYNSQSGRYEPAPGRAGPFRGDPQGRQQQQQQQQQPSLLQRTSGDRPEPSAAFQSNRSTQEGSFGRRRGSSNLGNPPYQQRFSNHEQHLNMPGGRRTSIAASTDSPVSPRNFSPSGLQGGPRLHSNQPRPSQASPVTSHASLQGGPSQPGQAEVAAVDDYELQKKIMREKRELAMQRRREEEAREEAEKQKRIKAKLDAMGPPPERKRTKSSAHEDASAALHIQQRQPHVAEPGAPASSREQATPSAQTPSLTSVTSPATAFSNTAAPSASERPGDESISPGKQPLPVPVRGRPDPRSSAMDHPELPNLHDRANSNAATWGQAPGSKTDRYVSWGPSNHQPSGNVWAPNTRGLGNGTFNAALGRAPSSQSSQPPAPSPAQPLKPGPAPIAPPSVHRPHEQHEPPMPGHRPTASQLENNRSKWSNAIIDGDRALLEESRSRLAERERQLAERGLSLADAIPEIKDTWRPAPKNPLLDARREAASKDHLSSANPAVFGSSGASMLPSSPTGSKAARPSRFFPAKDAKQDIPPSSAAPGRPKSPSPPPPDTAGHPAFDGDAHHPHVSLPPPQPRVRLPPTSGAVTSSSTSKPDSAAPAAPLSWAGPAAAHGNAAPTTGRPRGQPGSWDVPSRSAGDTAEKIRNLFSDRKQPAGRKVSAVTSPPKATIVEPISRRNLDVTGRNQQATVCLPQDIDMLHGQTRARGRFHDDTTSYVSKPASEECFEAQEMGSLPLVRMPREMSEAAWHPAPPPNRAGSRKLMPNDVTSAGTLWVMQDTASNGSPEYRIRFPGMQAMKSVPAPSLRTRSNPRRGPGRGSRSSHGQSHRGGTSKGRDSASSQAGDNQSQSSQSQSRGGGRGSYRGRSSDWSRRTPSTS